VKLEERLRRELHDTAEQLVIRPGDYEAVVRTGRRRRVLSFMGSAAMVLGAVAVLVVAANLPVRVPVASTTTLAPVTTTTTTPVIFSPSTVVVAGREGITVTALAGGGRRDLTSDRYYDTIAGASSDGAGGLVFVHEVTPLPWAQGSLMWLPAGAAHPVEVVTAGSGEWLQPVGAIAGGEFVYRANLGAGAEVRAVDLASGAGRRLVPASDVLVDVAVAGDRLVVVYGGDCSRVEIRALPGGEPVGSSPLEQECLPSINAVGMAGGLLYTIEDAATRQLVVRAVASGETIATLPDLDAWELEVAADGTLAYGGGTVVVGRFTDGRFEEASRVANAATFALGDDLQVRADATLGSGSGALPCTPVTVAPLPDQGLPGAVTAKRDALFRAAAACDFTTLAEIAATDGTSLSFGGEDDLIRSWVFYARHGTDMASLMVRMFNTDPASASSEFGVYYAWPAVHLTNSEEDWQALSGVLTAAEFDLLYRYRENGYAGFRTGIGEDGRWWFAVPGGD
jgi:hypothetical protein